jgi:U6 snRNA-associated Sm-like protein LSm2
VIGKNLMLFFEFFQTQVGNQVIVELKNDVKIQGELEAVDQFLNIKLKTVKVLDEKDYPHLAALKNAFIRGSVVRYVHLAATAVNTDDLQDKCRRELLAAK